MGKQEQRKLLCGINLRKNMLRKTDYQAIKYAEGMLTEEEYAPIKAKRQAWRDEINELEMELEAATRPPSGVRS